MGIVAGWGRLSEGGQLPNILQYVSNTSGTSTRERAIIAWRGSVKRALIRHRSLALRRKVMLAPLMQQQFPMDSAAAAGEEQCATQRANGV